MKQTVVRVSGTVTAHEAGCLRLGAEARGVPLGAYVLRLALLSPEQVRLRAALAERLKDGSPKAKRGKGGGR